MIGPAIKFLMRLALNCQDNLITVPKIISIANNLLANYQIRDLAVIGLRTLSYELFFLLPAGGPGGVLPAGKSRRKTAPSENLNDVDNGDDSGDLNKEKEDMEDDDDDSCNINPLMSESEIDTQKEVVLQFLEKFIENVDCQRVLNLLLLIEHLQQRHLPLSGRQTATPTTVVTLQHSGQDQSPSQLRPCLPNADQLCEAVLRLALQKNAIIIYDWNGFRLMEAFFLNNLQRILGSSKMFLMVLDYLANVVSSGYDEEVFHLSIADSSTHHIF